MSAPGNPTQAAPAQALPKSSGFEHPAESSQVVDSQRLLAGAEELLIRHGEQVYRLRHTRQGKLILTK